MEGPLVAAVRTGYLGLGSNLGDRAANLRAAVAALQATTGIEVTARASLYETAPQGEVLDQPDFLNSAVKIGTALEPLDLLEVCKRIEDDLGRESDWLGPRLRHGPRPIDIDLLLLGDLQLVHERLTLPHPEIATRHFVLAPLLELDPDLTLPDGRRAADLLAAVADQPVRRWEPA